MLFNLDYIISKAQINVNFKYLPATCRCEDWLGKETNEKICAEKRLEFREFI